MRGFKVCLLTEAEGLDDSTITIDIVVVEILQQLTALTYKHRQRTGGVVVLVILLQVLCQVRDAIAEKGDLCLCGTCVGSAIAILTDDLFFLGFV